MKISYLRWALLRKCCFSCSVWKYHKNWCSLAGIYFVFKNWLPQVSIIVSTSRKNCFQLTKNFFPLARKSVFISSNMPFLLKLASTSFSDSFHLEEKRLNKRKQFLLARKSISTSRNEGFCWSSVEDFKIRG